MPEYVGALIELGLTLFCLIECIQTPGDRVRNLPTWAWILLILVVPYVGSIAWLVAGKPWAGMQTNRMPYKGNTGRPGAYVEADRPRRAVATNPDDDEEFLAGLRLRAEEQRRRAREARPAIDPKPPTDEDGSPQH